METVYYPREPGRFFGFQAVINVAHFPTHSTVWDITIGPHEDKDNSYKDGLTRDGRPYYLSHSLCNTKGSAERHVTEQIHHHTDAGGARVYVIR